MHLKQKNNSVTALSSPYVDDRHSLHPSSKAYPRWFVNYLDSALTYLCSYFTTGCSWQLSLFLAIWIVIFIIIFIQRLRFLRFSAMQDGRPAKSQEKLKGWLNYCQDIMISAYLSQQSFLIVNVHKYTRTPSFHWFISNFSVRLRDSVNKQCLFLLKIMANKAPHAGNGQKLDSDWGSALEWPQAFSSAGLEASSVSTFVPVTQLVVIFCHQLKVVWYGVDPKKSRF